MCHVWARQPDKGLEKNKNGGIHSAMGCSGRVDAPTIGFVGEEIMAVRSIGKYDELRASPALRPGKRPR